jgi:hypothetical protein
VQQPERRAWVSAIPPATPTERTASVARRLSEKAHRLQPPQPVGIVGQPVLADHRLFVDDLLDVAQEPRVEVGDRVDFLDGEALAERLADLEDAGRGSAAQRRGDLVARRRLRARARG